MFGGNGKAFIKLIIGLGNPGQRYRLTRHNAGFLACERFAAEQGIRVLENGFFCRYGIGWLHEEEILVALCQTYMNQSGEAVMAFHQAFPVSPENWLVVTDDFHLPLGALRFRREGSSGGHKGLESVSRRMGAGFGRLRLGIGPKPANGNIPSFVLSRFHWEERTAVEGMIARASEALNGFIRLGIDSAMTRFNTVPRMMA